MANGNIQGSNYVQNPNIGKEAYNTVEGRTARNSDITIPSSGTTPTNGVTYLWSVNLDTGEGGFTGKSWLLDLGDVNPLVKIGNLHTNGDVINYLITNRNFNYIFSEWDPYYDDWDKFNGAFNSDGSASGCAQIN